MKGHDAVIAAGRPSVTQVSHMNGSSSLKGLGYLLEQFPKTTQTFVVREIEALRAIGGTFPIVSVRRPDGEPAQDYASAILKGIHYLPKDPRKPEKNERWQKLLKTYKDHPEQRRMHEAILTAEWFQQLAVRHVHCHFAGIAARTALLMKRHYGMPYSVTVHANDVFLHGAEPPLSLDDIIEEASFVVTETDFMARILRQRFPAIGRRVYRVHNGISLPPPPERTHTGARRGHRVVAVGRYIEKKGFEDLIYACAALSDLDFRCSIIGFGPLEPYLRKKIVSLGLSERVELTGPRTLSQIFSALHDADVFVLPSVQARDGGMDNLPTVLMEAMAMQLPVVSTRTAGIPEMVVDGETGLLVPERNPAALATAVRALLSDPARARQMASAGRSYAERRFDRRITTKALLRLFEAALTVRGSAAVSRRAEAVKKPTNKSS